MAYKLYTVKEVAALCRVGPHQVRYWIKSRQLQACRRPGSTYLLIRDDWLVLFQIKHYPPLYPRS